jgi:hypothetical protein
LINLQQSERKIMRKSISVLALLVALTCSAFAGDMQNGVTGTPQPTPTPALMGPTNDGEIPTWETDTNAGGDVQNGVVASFIEVVLNLLDLS